MKHRAKAASASPLGEDYSKAASSVSEPSPCPDMLLGPQGTALEARASHSHARPPLGGRVGGGFRGTGFRPKRVETLPVKGDGPVLVAFVSFQRGQIT